MSVFSRFSRVFSDFVKGIRRGIPVCCTIFYTVERFLYPEKDIRSEIKSIRGITDETKYVQCDLCHSTHKRVQLKEHSE